MKSALRQLARRGYAVLDGAFGLPRAETFLQEICTARDSGVMYKNATHLVSRDGSTSLLEKGSIYEWDSKHPDWAQHSGQLPSLDALARDRSLVNEVNAALAVPAGRPALVEAQALKLQHNAGSGGCFNIHYDTDASVDGRVITAILYLNPNWAPGDGGELVVYPFPSRPVTIEPRMDRMVLFSSANMPHRVLPSAVDRYCLTLWLSAGEAAQGAALDNRTEKDVIRQIILQGAEPDWDDLMHPAARKLLAKEFHAEEWEESIVQAHRTSQAVQEALAAHHNNVGIIRKIFRKSLPYVHSRVADLWDMDKCDDGMELDWLGLDSSLS